jgi:hypothetical protein
MPRRLFVSSQNRLALSWLYVPDAPANTTDPAVKAVAVPVPPLATGSVPVTWLVRLTPESVPPSVRFPALVTVPVNVMPFTVPVPPTLVTEPEPLLLNVVQSAADNAPRLAADAVGT